MAPVIPASNLAAMAATLCVCFLFPALLWILLGRGRRGFSRAVLAGTVGFVVPQLLLRLPLLQLISGQGWYLRTLGSGAVVQALFLAVTAGLFETAGRYLVFRFLLRRPLSPRLGVAVGLGHGGAEAILVVGLTYVSNLVLAFLVGSGGVPLAGQAKALADVLAGTRPTLFLLAGYERVCTVLVHMSLSLLLALFWMRGRRGRGFWACAALHALVDFATPMASLYAGLWGAYAILTASAAAGGAFIWAQLRRESAPV